MKNFKFIPYDKNLVSRARELRKEITETILLPAIQGMASEGRTFKGVLYAGLMISKEKKNSALIYGPSGTGKTCSVYAIANELGK